MSGHLAVLDKQPGIYPFKVGETWRRLFAKIMLNVTGPEATSTCQDDHMCDGIKAGIDGAAHGVQDILDSMSTTEENVFNTINQIGMLWTTQQL